MDQLNAEALTFEFIDKAIAEGRQMRRRRTARRSPPQRLRHDRCRITEQHEIVGRVDQLFAFADQIEARYARAQAHVDKLTRSLLAKAFRGKLVPQDPNDEPASALLARIRIGVNGAEKPSHRKAKTVA